MDKIPFDLEAFKLGAIALDSQGVERRFNTLYTSTISTKGLEDDITTHQSLDSVLSKWAMKPTSGGSEDWIKHDGGPNPIPWAQAGDWECRDKTGCHIAPQVGSASGIWSGIIAYRLTDGWAPVKGDGTIPEEIRGAKAGEWEVKFRNMKTVLETSGLHMYSWHHYPVVADTDIVAVRLVKKAEAIIGIDRGIKNMTAITKARRETNGGIRIKSIRTIDTIDISPKQRLTREASIEQERIYGQQFTAEAVSKRNWVNAATTEEKRKQRQLTADDSTEYFAKLHAKSEPVLPLGESGVESAIFEALCKSMENK